MAASLEGKRIFVTQAGEFTGPVLCEVLAGHGAELIASSAALLDPAALVDSLPQLAWVQR